MEHETILLDFWSVNCTNAKSNIHQDKREKSNWNEQIKTLYANGISMEDALHFVHSQQPEKENFIKWIHERKRFQPEIDTKLIHDVLSPEDLIFWEKNGYFVLRNIIPEQQINNTCQAIWNYLEASIDDEESWYKYHPGKRGMMLQFSDHPAIDLNRQSAQIKKAYEQLYGHSEIHKSIDKVGFNPPIGNNYSFAGSPLHWDTSLKLPIPYKLQGLLYLTDCDDHEGAFHCVPRFHHQIQDWMNTLPEHSNPREEALKQLKPIPVNGKAGDFVIWNQALPHCATPNQGKLPRMTQYLTYLPNHVEEQNEWI